MGCRCRLLRIAWGPGIHCVGGGGGRGRVPRGDIGNTFALTFV